MAGRVITYSFVFIVNRSGVYVEVWVRLQGVITQLHLAGLGIVFSHL